METKPFYVICSSLTGIETVIDELHQTGINPCCGVCESLSRPVEVVDYMDLSDTTSIVNLTYEEAEALKHDDRVVDVVQYREQEIELHDLPSLKVQVLNTSMPWYSSVKNPNRENWGLTFCSTITSVSSNDFNYFYTGSGVNVVVIDTGITANHPEWNSPSSGTSRLQRINWSHMFPLTSSRTINVSVSTNPDGSRFFVLNGVQRPIVYISSINYYSTLPGRTPVIIGPTTFILDGTTTSNFPFTILGSNGLPLLSANVTNNGATSGNVVAHFIGSRGPSFSYTCLTSSGMGNMVLQTPYNLQNSNFYTDLNGHGTHCTGTIAGSSYGWAKEANIYSIKLFNDNVSNAYTDLEAFDLTRMLALSTGRPTVCNNSWGYVISRNVPNNSQQSACDAAVKTMVDSGVHFVHSAGNDSLRTLLTPTYSSAGTFNFDSRGIHPGGTAVDFIYRESSPKYPYSSWGPNDSLNPGWTVGSLGYRTDTTTTSAPYAMVAEYSNVGPGITVYAPGSFIQSAWITAPNVTNYRGTSAFKSNLISGTSMSGPQVAGILATYLEANPTASPLSAKNYLLNNVFADDIFYNPNIPNNFTKTSLSNKIIKQYPPRFVISNTGHFCIRDNEICYSNTTNQIVLNNEYGSNRGVPVLSANCATCIN